VSCEQIGHFEQENVPNKHLGAERRRRTGSRFYSREESALGEPLNQVAVADGVVGRRKLVFKRQNEFFAADDFLQWRELARDSFLGVQFRRHLNEFPLRAARRHKVNFRFVELADAHLVTTKNQKPDRMVSIHHLSGFVLSDRIMPYGATTSMVAVAE